MLRRLPRQFDDCCVGLNIYVGTTSLAVTSTSIESLKSFPQEAEELIVATERNAKLRYVGYKKLSEM